MEEFLRSAQSLSPWAIYGIVFGFAFVENLFPPSPSDLVIVFAGSLAGMGSVGFLELLMVATAGSTLGFMMMFGIGEWFGDHILKSGKIKFLPLESVEKAERWFARYGYWLIVANRFLAGTRAVVSFFAGMSELRLLQTTSLCMVSALLWNLLLILGGFYLGANWQEIGWHLRTYSETVTTIVVVVTLVLVGRYFWKRRNQHD